jgi:CRISPR-associated endoribonuclease Cas6
MRLRIAISTLAKEIPWESVLKPGRSFAYTLLEKGAPELGARLHEKGWGTYGMVPFGHSAPVFPSAPRLTGKYAVGGTGWLELGSLMTEVIQGWALGLAGTQMIDWGGVALRVQGVSVVDSPPPGGTVRFRTSNPVVMKGSGRVADGTRVTRQAWVLPGDEEYGAYFAQNLRRKAETLGLAPEIELDRITWTGPKRSFAVKDGHKSGAAVEVELSGAGEVLAAIRDWGLGQANSGGFGWVGAWS